MGNKLVWIVLSACLVVWGCAPPRGVVANLRAIALAERTYQQEHAVYAGFPQLVQSGLIDTRYLEGAVEGYNYSMVVSGQTYTISATPLDENRYTILLNSSGKQRSLSAAGPGHVDDKRHPR